MWTGRHTAILGAASVVSLAVGSVSGYLYARRVLGAQFDARLEEEIKQTKAFYENLQKPDPDDLAAHLVGKDFDGDSQINVYDTQTVEMPEEIAALANKFAEAEAEIEEEAQPLEYNAFEDAPKTGWDQQYEDDSRKNGIPYIVSEEEFNENALDHEQGHLTWYGGDNVLADSKDEVISDETKYVGDRALDNFGHGSQDPNIVFVRNEMMEMDFEIAKSNKSYSEDVLGFLQHSDRPRKFRDSRADG